MHKFFIACLFLAVFCSAEPSRYRFTSPPARLRLSARQQQSAEPPAPNPTGYPVAGVTPEVSFDLPTETEKPDNTYLPPDSTYGPPESEHQPDAVYGPPDSTYGPPPAVEDPQPEAPPETEVQQEPALEAEEPVDEEDEEIVVTVRDDGSVVAVSNSLDQGALEAAAVAAAGKRPPARLVYQRFPQGRRNPAPASGPVPARLVNMRHRIRPMNLPLRMAPQPQAFVYTSRFEQW